jgi:hypothetical protein
MGRLFFVAMWLLSSTLGTEAYAHLYKGLPYCPTYAKSNSWAKFMAGEYGLSAGTVHFSIKFDHINHDIGTIAAGRCYTASTNGKGYWNVSGYNVAQKQSVSDTRQGDPSSTYRMNVWGRTFTFDETGAVYDSEFGRVGTMKCDIGSSC